MAGEPEVVQRADQAYVAIKALVTMQTLGTVLPGLHPEVSSWMRARDVAKAGAPFWKYNVIDMERQMEVEVGFPVAVPVAGDDRGWCAAGREVRDAAAHWPSRYLVRCHRGTAGLGRRPGPDLGCYGNRGG
jgi:hypothetical protein